MNFTRSLVVVAVAALSVACGVSDVEVDGVEAEDLTDDSAELSTTKDTYLIARRDYRKCVSPMCGGYWVKDLNSTMQEKYVSAFDFTDSNVPEAMRGEVTGAPDHELVLFGRLGPKESRFNTRTLLVKLAYRGLPGQTFAASDKFYGVFPSRIVCVRAPCAYLQTTRLNRTTGHTMATEVDLSAALAPYVNEEWLRSRVMSGKTVIAGTISRRSGNVTVRANQVFVQLPDRVSACPVEAPPSCSGFTVPGFMYTGDRCVLPTGECTPIGVCAAFHPECDEGYRLITYVNVCPRHVCEPAFLEP